MGYLFIHESTCIGFSRTAPLILASLSMVVVAFNRLVWAPLYRYVNHRFVLEG